MVSTQQFTSLTDWVVPVGVTRARWDIRGGEGAKARTPGGTHGTPGKGGRVFGALLDVTPEETLRINVGRQPATGITSHIGAIGGSGGGDGIQWVGGTAYASGGGGGSTDVRRGGTTLQARVLVAAGGGGVGLWEAGEFWSHGGSGGAATGQQGFLQNPGEGGGGGTQTAGGVGGNKTGGIWAGTGTAGAGGDYDPSTTDSSSSPPFGGGGGGGLFGGGAGGDFGTEGYGGGGGSNKTVVGASSVRGHQSGHGIATVEWNLKPLVEVIGPTGIITDTSQPTVTWDYSDLDTSPDPQASYRVVVRQDPSGTNTVVYDSGFISSSANSHELPVLDNGNEYEVDVIVRQVASGIENDESDPDTISFSLDLDTPDAPILILTPEPDNARMVIEVDDPTVAPDPEAEWFVVEFSDEGMDGPWTSVRGGSRVEAPGPVVLYDYENRFNEDRWYRARSFYDDSGQDIGSDPTIDSEQLFVDKAVVWITDPLDPDDTHLTVQPTADRERTWQGREIVHAPADMEFSVVESEVSTRQDSISFLAVDPAAHDDLVKLFGSGRTLLYRDDRREHFYFRWAGDRRRSQVGGRRLDADIFTASQAVVKRPSS